MCLTVGLSRSGCRKRSQITEGMRKLRSLDLPILTVGLIKFLGAKFVLDSGFGGLALIKYFTSGADAFRGNTRTHPEHDG